MKLLAIILGAGVWGGICPILFGVNMLGLVAALVGSAFIAYFYLYHLL